MRRLCISFVLVTLGFQVHGHSFAADHKDRSLLVEGVTEIAVPGVVGSLSVYGPDAFVIATGETKSGQPAALAAAATLGKGRLVALGHNGYFSRKNAQVGQTGKFVSNLMLWCAGLNDSQSRQLQVGVLGNRDLVNSLKESGLKTKELTGNWSSNLRGLNLIICDPRSLTKQEATKLIEFTKAGNGLLLGAAGWVWEGYNAKQGEALVNDFPGNIIGSQAGLVWDSPTLNSPANKRIAITKTLPESTHAAGALQSLEENPQSADTKLAVETISRTLQSICGDDELFLPQLQKMLEQKLGEVVIPGRRNEVKNSQPLARLQVALNTRLALGQPIEKLTASPLAEEFPKQPAKRIKPTDKTVSINTQVPRWHSTGLFAKAGDVVSITVPAAAIKAGLGIQVGCHKDKLWHKAEWSRAPEITREFAITKTETKVGNAFGGLIYVVVPNDCKLGEIDVEISGAVSSPLFILGETSIADWRKIRSLPGPWAELASDRFILTVPSEAIRELNRPDQLMGFWNQVLDTCADLAMISPERKYPERFVTDVQISAGYMHAGYPIMAPLNLALETTDLQTLQEKGNWGVFHEIGHNHQQPEWTWDGLGEVTVNLFSMYVFDTLVPGATQHGQVQPANIAKMRREFEQTGKLEGPWPRLVPYIELKQNFGWQPFKKVFAEYQEIPRNKKPKTLQEKKDLWLVMFSRAVGKDLSDFYDGWNFGASDQAKQAVSDLPKWSPSR
ncbi:M60 family metallopeptidase [Thalassoglobus sp.]|uniref:M60 family metallopeptidase n=1 Tax=Thalassoglobus sp. TaxID=2795869 RepID=UPI003AA9E032